MIARVIKSLFTIQSILCRQIVVMNNFFSEYTGSNSYIDFEICDSKKSVNEVDQV
jgi:type VI protein secretion system component VasA